MRALTLWSRLRSCRLRSCRRLFLHTHPVCCLRTFHETTRGSSPITRLEAVRDPEEDAVEPAIPGVEDHRSPYERFRSKKGALTVTDLVSNLWCEQQLEYTLIRGFKRRTPAMKAGSSVHRVLEEQVHTIVPVEVKTKEDRWGLKLFNMCQGLWCLETEGLTRELPVFGFIDDVLVRGIIDEVVYKDPAGKTEDSKTSNDEGSYKTLRRNSKAYINQQPEEYNVPQAGSRVAYISDVKSRARRSLPTASQAKATALQLMSYHRLLDQMRAGETDFPRLLDHYKLNGDAPLSDSLIADLCRVSEDVSVDTVLEHNSLTGMWELMRKYLATSIDSIGGNMGISYRDQADGKIFAYQTIPYNGERLDAHLGSVMSWWRGQRSTVGVEIEEAWKCASCEFADDCSWRLGKLSELKKKRQVPVYYPFARKA
ncbi:hypothetical protein EX30DRAFT_343542 [Ascodesmis nigricans]|uniref:Exonuclease V n=1 Tax=Ascodesmis nigricans TaxID=341454 RepID=A0A4S2MM65_9PEZI|nr:hypothetical protein EX30DRAFT_343542 [Ascodesmis nigricans]